MENLEFLGVLTVAALIIGWYIHNDAKKADGDIGWLALKPDVFGEAEASRRRYRIKPRVARRARDLRTLDAAKTQESARPAYRERDDAERARRRFRRQDEARYRVRDKNTGDFERDDRDD